MFNGGLEGGLEIKGMLVGVLVGKSKQHIGRNSVLIVCQKG